MITEHIAEKLRHAASSVLGMMFMAPVRSDEEFPPPGVAYPILVLLDFNGEVKGTFVLAVAAATAQKLALSFMGMEPGERLLRPAVVEVLGELANMLCGHFLGQLQYHEAFALSSPREIKLAEIRPIACIYQRTVHLDHGALSMQVALEE